MSDTDQARLWLECVEKATNIGLIIEVNGDNFHIQSFPEHVYAFVNTLHEARAFIDGYTWAISKKSSKSIPPRSQT